ncbi:DUF1540 domain-containing protein [Neobacillus drentensis]|uniref:DUF1540 domain-containing protein n=1 Tax=Neobacillus drentensis TaxID=220684 RepID=UPI000BF787CC|nr:DUF1540 domain-containing protein [Bacillus sp. AFS006103]
MPKVEVSCAISNCSFYGQGNVCTAEKIMVELDNHARYDTEMSSELGEMNHVDQAGHSAETCCKTFKPKRSKT